MKSATDRVTRVAIAQFAPVYHNKTSSLTMALELMPLARMAMHQVGEPIHVAVWPTVNEMAQLAGRRDAFEGRCFELAVGLMMRTTDIPARLPHDIKEHWVERGGSSIIQPDAGYVVNPFTIARNSSLLTLTFP